MKKTFFIKVITIIVLLPFLSPAQEADANTPLNFDKKIATIQLMSYMNYVVYTLSSYRNPFVIEDEYRNLDDNLYLDRVDEDCIAAITGMLDTINSMRVADKRRDHFLEGQARIVQQTRADLFLNIAKASVSSGMQTVALGAQVIKGDTQAIAELTKAIADESIGVYERWVDVQRRLEQESSNFKFDYDMGKDSALHEQNKKQLAFQHKLTEKYRTEDKYRLSKENARDLIEVVKSSDKKGAFKRMRLMKANPAYDKFPMFWCYYAEYALDSGDTKEALAACNHFSEINRHSVFKHDRMSALIAMTEISAMLKSKAIDVDKVRKALKAVKAYNYNSKDVDMAYFCASTYYFVLEDTAEAKRTLEALIAVLEDAAHISLTKYCDLFDPDQSEKQWEGNPPPVMTDLFRCHTLLRTILDSQRNEGFRNELEAILESSTASSMEKLFFVGDVRVKDLWQKARLDVEAIQLRYEMHDLFSKNSLVALIPISWFALGDFPIQIDLMRGGTKVKTLEEVKNERKLVFYDLIYAKIEIQCPTAALKGVDSYVLRLPHKSWPMAIQYNPPVNVDVKNAKFEGSSSLFIPQRADFMDQMFPLYEENDKVSAELFHVQLKEVGVPRKLLRKSLADFGRQAMLKETQLYVEISRRMGEVIWRSPAVDVSVATDEGIELFEFSKDDRKTSFASMWKPGDRMVVSVKVAEKSRIDATSTTKGSLSGMAVGAGIGAASAAAFTGGLGAPAGALIGGVYGFLYGAGIGAATLIEGSWTVVSFVPPSDEFCLNGTLERKVSFSGNDIQTASIKFEGGQRRDPVLQNGLQLQKDYVVRLRGVSISSKAPKFKDGAEYYMLISLFGEEKPLRIELPSLRADIFISTENTLGLKNCGGESSVEIRRKGMVLDTSVFKAVQGATNGSSWVFIGKSSDDYGSYVEFDTFPAGE